MLIQGASVEVVQGASNEEQRVPRNSSWLVDVPFQLLVCHTFFSEMLDAGGCHL